MIYLFLKDVGIYLSSFLPIKTFYIFTNELVLVSSNIYIRLICFILNKHTPLQFKILTCISGVDFITRFNRFELNYEFLSLHYNFRLRLKTYSFSDLNYFFSITNTYPAASWWEREVWDMFGLFFYFNDDLRKILTDYGFQGYPLRKDFPVSGYTELSYSALQKKFITNPLEVPQTGKLQKNTVWL